MTDKILNFIVIFQLFLMVYLAFFFSDKKWAQNIRDVMIVIGIGLIAYFMVSI